MSERWQSYELQQVERVPGLDRAIFRERFQGQRPLIVPGGALDSPMLARWDLSYLAQAAGHARVTVAAYPEDRRDFGSIEPREMSLAEFLRGLAQPARDEVRYLFNDPSCVFARNEAITRLHVGWAAALNAGLAPLAADFRVPSFVASEEYVLAVLILGSRDNATALHYDNGGEAKVVVQVRGRKRIILFPPQAAPALRPHTHFRRPEIPGRAGSHAMVDIHAPADASASADAPAGWVAELEPGDVAYWPPFWFHDVENLDDVTMAVGVFVDEVRLPALLLRHTAHLVFQELLAGAAARARGDGAAVQGGSPNVRAGWGVELAVGDRPAGNLAELFQELERTLLATDASDVRGLWEWNGRLGRDR
ncbi:MAG: cupin-like domain-containing protein [Actinomycetota bacterium]